MDIAICDYEKVTQNNWLEKQDAAHAEESSQVEDREIEIGPGLIRPHLITDEFVRTNPLWSGTGKGLFKDEPCPKTTEELLSVFTRLLIAFVHRRKGGPKIVDQAENTFRRRGYDLLRNLEGGVEVPLSDVREFLGNSAGAFSAIVAQLLLFTLPEEMKNGTNVPGKSRSLWARRIHIAVSKHWGEWKDCDTLWVAAIPKSETQQSRETLEKNIIEEYEAQFSDM